MELFCNCHDCRCSTGAECTENEHTCCGTEHLDPYIRQERSNFISDVLHKLPCQPGSVQVIAPLKERT